MNSITCLNAEDPSRKQLLTPTPYNLDISLYVLTKTTEDGLAILEQILPVFRPDYTLSIKAINDLNVIMDVPIILNNVSVDDQYEGDFETRRVITHTYNFTAKIGVFGGINNASVINSVYANLATEDSSSTPTTTYNATASTPVSEIVEAWTLFGDNISDV